jgi:nucleotide-binding universal stress UspA family protein
MLISARGKTRGRAEISPAVTARGCQTAGFSSCRRGRVLAPWTGMIAIERILVATDFGAASESALSYGRQLARRFGASLHVLHITENVFTRVSDAYGYVPMELQAEVEAIKREQTEALVDDEDRRELRAVATTVTSNCTADAIVDYASTNGIDLIVIGTHGRRAVTRLFMGSVAERVVRLASCPVLTVRNPEKDFVLPDVPVLYREAGLSVAAEQR